MSIRNWWGRKSASRARKTPAKRSAFRPTLERLETREVPATVYALTNSNQILQFDSATPGTITNTAAIQNLNAGELVVGMDFRPRTGQLFALAVDNNGSGTTGRLLTVNPLTGTSVQIGANIVIPGAGSPDGFYGFDFNPTVDRIRVVNGADANFRLNPNNGTIAGVDTNINPAGQFIDNSAYDRNFDGLLGANGTTLYAINLVTGMLQTQGGLNQNPSPNTGTLINVGALGTTFDTNSYVGFDIQANGQAQQGLALAVFDGDATAGIASGLYRINLVTGQATLVGLIDASTNGTRRFVGIAIVPESTLVDGGTPGVANVLNGFTGQPTLPTITPFAGYTGGLLTATGDVNRDSVPDLIVAPTLGGNGGHVMAINGANGQALFSFLAFPGFGGTINVGAGDVNGDGFADIIVVANNANAHVKAFSGANGQEIASFFAFPGFLGVATLSAADFNNDGTDEIVVGAGGAGANGRFAIFNANGTVFNAGQFAFQGFGGSIFVAAGDVNGDGIPDVIVGAGAGAPGGHVKAFSGVNGNLIASFFAFDASYVNGVAVATSDFNRDGRFDIRASQLSGGSLVRTFDLAGIALNTFQAFPNTSGATIGGARP